MAENGENDGVCREGKRHDRSRKAHVDAHPEWRQREARQSIQSQARHSPLRILGGTRSPLLAVVIEGNLLEPYPGHQTAEEPVLLSHRIEDLYDSCRHNSQVTDVSGDVGGTQSGKYGIEEMSRGPFEPRLSHPADAPTVDDIGLLPRHELHHVAYKFRRVLQIRVENHDAIATAVEEAGSNR